MSRLDGLRHRLHVLRRGDAYDEDIQRELRFHSELAGLAREGATLGNETFYREEVRRMTLLSVADRLRQDAVYAMRGLRRSPGFAVGLMLTLGLGVGVNAGMYSLLSPLYVQPPNGVTRPGEVRRLYVNFENGGHGRVFSPQLEYPQYAALRAAVPPTIPLGIFVAPDSTSVRDGESRIPVRVSYVNRDFFSVLGVRPTVGRFFAPEEDHVETPAPVMVLSDALWRRAFGANPQIVGRRMKLGGGEITIIGVAGAGFAGIDVDAADAWLPASMYESSSGYNGIPWYRGFGGGFRVVARPAGIGDERRITTAGTNAIRPVRIPGGVYDSTITLSTGPILEALGPLERSGAMRVATRIAWVVLLVLLIAAANITNLLLLRTTSRGREMAVRRALGVSRTRLFQQIAVEALVASVGAGAVALAFAAWTGAALRHLMLPSVHWATGVIDARVAASIAVATIGLGLVCCIAPTVEVLRSDLTASLRAAPQGGRGSSRIHNSLLALQTALCVVLLVGAGLFLRSLQNVTSIGIGFDVENRLFLSATFDDPKTHANEVATAIPIAAQRLRSMNGVEDVAYANHAPIIGTAFRSIFLPGHDSLPQLVAGQRGPGMSSVSPGYFGAVGLRLIAGRDFTVGDRQSTPPVAIVSKRLAELYWPGDNPLGKCVVLLRRDGPCAQIVGVATDAHRSSILELPTTQFYLPIEQTGEAPRQIIVHYRNGRETAVVRSADEIMRSLVPALLSMSSRRFDRVNDRELRPWRLGATLFTALGVLSLVVAAVGVYSVVAYGVSRRTHEMGVRIALGAQRSDIVDLVVGGGMKAIGLGLVGGAASSLLLGRLLNGLLFGVLPNDATALIAALTVLVLVGGTASLVPAWRAAAVEPMQSLRAE
jgi:predicted permease